MILHSTSGRWRLGLGLSLLNVFLWGVLPIALTITLQALDVYTVTWFRFLLSFILLAVYLGMRGELPKRTKLRSVSWQLLAIAIIFLAGNYILFLQGLALTSPSTAEVLIQLAPVLLGLGGLVIFKERYNFAQWLGVSILTVGFILFFNEQLTNLITAQGRYLFGCGLLILGAASWAIYALAQKQLLQKLSSAKIMLMIYGGCALLLSPFVTPASLLTLSLLHWAILVFCALNTVVAYGAFAESLQHWEASRVSAVLALAPIVTLIAVELTSVFTPHLIAPENLTVLAVVGAILVVVGSVAIALGKNT